MENSCIDFAQLRDLTGGDDALEGELFRLFLSDSMECMHTLKSAITLGNNELWRDQAHMLKGISANLGAVKLAELCGKAQKDYSTNEKTKQIMLDEIESALSTVNSVLRQKILNLA